MRAFKLSYFNYLPQLVISSVLAKVFIVLGQIFEANFSSTSVFYVSLVFILMFSTIRKFVEIYKLSGLTRVDR